MNIRFVNPNDAEQISELYYGWNEFRGILSDELIELEIKKRDSQDISKNNRKYIVATIDEKIVGVCYIDTEFINLGTIRIGDMFVNTNYRKKGIATALIKKTVEYANEHDVKKIWLWTQKELSSAIKCYENNGFVLEGTQLKQFCGKDALLYGLVLRT